jgi:N-acetylglutamate synthase-like GNAT family acetyltransferase
MIKPGHQLTKNSPSPGDMEFLEDRIYEYNSQQTGQDDGQLFAFWIRDEEGKVLGGLTGWTWAQACEIRTLWVHPDWRGQGYGRELLQAAETEAVEHGCKVILIASYSFQAPGFYLKMGYILEWCVEDFPPGHRNCYLVKRIGEKARTAD